jgi:hypothetical protein
VFIQIQRKPNEIRQLNPIPKNQILIQAKPEQKPNPKKTNNQIRKKPIRYPKTNYPVSMRIRPNP